jgi:hypothetical protein
MAKKSPRAIIGSSPRYESAYYKTTNLKNPGPASYSHLEYIGKNGNAQTIIPKRKDMTPRAGTTTPAPGYYKSENDIGVARHTFNASFGSS